MSVQAVPDPADPADEPLALRLDFEDLEAGDIEDIATYADRDDVLALLYGAFEQARKAEPDQKVLALLAALPPKVFTALLGTARRRLDPEWTPEHWRKFRFIDLISNEQAPDPTSAGSTPGSTSEAPRSGPPTVRRPPRGGTPRSGPTR